MSFYAYFFWQVSWQRLVALAAYSSLLIGAHACLSVSFSSTAVCNVLHVFYARSYTDYIPTIIFLQRAARGGGGDLRARRGRRGGPWQWLWPKRKAY